jgi:hypothetical protein
LNDATILLRDMAGDVAQKAADKVNPSEDELQQIDKPAADNTWHDTPDLSAGNLKNQLKQTVNKNTPVNTEDLKQAAGDATQTAHPGDSRDPRDAARLGAQDAKQGGNSGVDAKAGAQQGLNTLKEKADNNTDDDTKQKAKEAKENAKHKTKNYLDSKMPEERRDQAIWRLKKMVVEIQGHQDYMQAVDTLLDLAEQYAGHASNVTQQTVGSVQGAHADTALQRAEKDLKTLIERFANNTSADDLMDAINQIYRDADRDPELKNWFKQIDAYVRKCLRQQGYIMEDRATDEWNQLYDRGNFLLRDRYRNHTDRITDEIKFLADQFDKDPHNRRFADACQRLFDDLGNDENGKPTFKPHLVKDLTDVILPAVFENIRYVPVPRIEYTDPMIDAVIENLVIESDNLTPNVLEFASDNYWRWGRKNIANRNKNAVMLSVSGVQMDLRDVSYYVRKKQGFPSVRDEGLMDIFLGGTGFSFKVKMSTADAKDRQNFFKVDHVDIDVKNFNIKLKQSRHKTLFNLFKPLMLKVLRPAIQKVLEKVIKDKINQLDGLLYSVKLEADKAKNQVKDDPEQAPNIYSRYVNAAQNKVMKGKKKAEAVASDKKVNVAMTQHDSIFPQVKLPGGISTKATEYKNLAEKGDKWESPIFGIGSAGRTTDLPPAGQITRKPHDVTSGGIRGPQNIGQTQSMTNQLKDDSALAAGQSSNRNATYGGNGSASYGTGAAGFSNQVDQAFSKDTTGITSTSGVGSSTGVAPTTGVSPATGKTTLGSNNPVLNGSARAY